MEKEHPINTEIVEANRRLKHLNRILKAIRNVNQTIVSEDDPRRLIERACLNLTEPMAYHNAWITLLGAEAARGLGLETTGPVAAIAAAGFDGGFETLRERLERGEFPECMAQALATEDVFVTDDPAVDCPHCPLSCQHSGRAGLVRRLASDGVIWGTLMASVPAAYAGDAEEQDLFNEVASDIAFALHQITAAREQAENRRYLALVIEGSGVGTWEWNVQTNHTHFNEQWAALLGYTIEELTPYDYTTWERLVHPADIERARQSLADCVEGRTPDYSCEFRMQHKEGHWVWILGRGRIMTRDEVGQALSMYGTHTDITEQKRLQNQALEAQSLLETILEQSPLPMWIGDAEGTLLRTNKELRDAVGVTDEQLVGLYHPLSDPNVERAGLTETVRNVIEKFEPARFTLLWRPEEYWGDEYGKARERYMDHVMYPIVRNGKLQNIVTQWQDITEQVRTEAALRESEHRLALATASAGIGTWVWDIVTDDMTWDERILQLYGITAMPDHAGFDYWQNCLHPDDRERAVEACLAAVRDGKTYEGEFRVQWPDGTVRWMQSNGVVVHDENGQPIRMLGTNYDITERKNALAQIADSLALINESQAAGHIGSWEYDITDDKILWSDEMYRIARIEVGAPLPGWEKMQSVFPQDWERLNAAVQRSIQQGDPYEEDFRILWPDGSVRWGRVQGSPVKDESGKVVRLVGTTQDITERKQAEDALRESEEKFRTFVETANDIIYQVSPDGVFTYASPNWVEILGYGLDEVIGATVDTFVHPDDVQICTDFLNKVLSTGEKQSGVEYRVQHKNGTWRWHSSNGAPVKDANGNIISYIGIARDITEIREQEKERLELHQRYRTVVKNFPNGAVFLFDKDMKYIHVEGKALEEVGLVPDKMIGKTVKELFPPEVSDVAYKNQLLLFEGKPCYYEVEFAGKIYANWGEPVINNENQIEEGVVFAVDITERKTAEKALRESEKRFATTFQRSPAPLVLSEIDTGRFIDFNDRWVEMLEFSREESIGKASKEVGIWEDPGERDRIVAILRDQGHIRDEPIRFKTKSGKTILALWSAETIDLSGKQIMLSMITDITQLKQAERELLQKQRSLDLYNQIATVFLTTSEDDVFAGVLNVILKLLDSRFGYFGYIDEAGNLVCPSMTRDIWDQCQVPEKSIVFPRSVWGGLWGRSLLEKRTLVASEGLRLPEGHVSLENALAAPILHNNTLIGQFVVANKVGGYDQADVALLEAAAVYTAPILFAIREEARQKTAHEKLEAQLRQAQKMEAVGRLAGGVAHDFNNMLTVVIGFAGMLLRQITPDHPFYADLTQIQKAGERSANLTRQLLAFARKQTVTPKVIDLNKTVAGMLKMLQRLIGEDIDMAWIPGDKVWPVKIDPGQIDQILANLCVNAQDAITDVGKVTIETGNIVFDEAYCRDNAGFTPGEYVMLVVSDNGVGMDSETLTQVFEPFFTTKEQGKGTGLGLSTVYGVVKQNNGFIHVYSEPGQGTTFKIYLPRHKAKATLASEKGQDRPGERGHETVLLVEDEPMILKMTYRMLEREGYTVVGASTPGEAIRLATEHAGDIELLITDVVMPEMNGRDLARNILSLYPGMKCLFMSGYTANVIAHHGVLEEGVNFIQKPFSLENLAVKVREALDRK